VATSNIFSWTNGRMHCFLTTLLLWLASTTIFAQQNAPPPAPAKDPAQEKQVEKKEQSQRMLGVIPEFGVTSRKDAPPLTPKGKFRLFYKSAFDPMQFALVGLEAGISQAENGFPAYRQGASGYGKRYGAAFTDQVSSGFFTNFLYPSLLKEDPRYFRLGQGSLRHRTGYALSQEFIAHKDRGGRTFNWSNMLGAVSAGGISNAYYPQEDRGFGLTMSRAGISVLYGSLGGLASEFWPDIYEKLHHRPKPPLVPGEQTQEQKK
jgi:hypothetical protein